MWYNKVHGKELSLVMSCGELGVESEGGDGVREFVADKKDLGVWLLRLEGETGGDTDLEPLSEGASITGRLSLGFLPCKMSFSLSGSSSKST